MYKNYIKLDMWQDLNESSKPIKKKKINIYLLLFFFYVIGTENLDEKLFIEKL